MASEMQERIARVLYEIRAQRAVRDDHWAHQVKAFRELADEFPDYPLGGDGVSDAFRDALAAMKAIQSYADEARDEWGFEHDDFEDVLKAEIAAAEEARRDQD